jgi:hypothetical protein
MGVVVRLHYPRLTLQSAALRRRFNIIRSEIDSGSRTLGIEGSSISPNKICFPLQLWADGEVKVGNLGFVEAILFRV